MRAQCLWFDQNGAEKVMKLCISSHKSIYGQQYNVLIVCLFPALFISFYVVLIYAN